MNQKYSMRSETSTGRGCLGKKCELPSFMRQRRREADIPIMKAYQLNIAI